MPLESLSPPDDKRAGSTPAEPAGAEAPEANLSPSLTLRPTGADQFARLRSMLADAGFTTPAIQERTGPMLFEELARIPDPSEGQAPADGLAALVHLFIHGLDLPRATVERTLPGELCRLLLGVGLLDSQPDDPGTLRAPLALYPARGLLIVSDHWRHFSGEMPSDVVYPALTTNTVEFIDALPADPCDALLDIGAGTGIAALLGASSYARLAWAADITSRSTQVAAFNARLNGIGNLRAVEGDLYAPVAGLRFDRIVAHPPYAPTPRSRIVYRDGGEDGEQVMRRIIEGLPEHLRPGGRLYCRCIVTDRKGMPAEQRVRAMLGAAEAGFDVMVVARSIVQPAPHFCRELARGQMTASEYEERMHGITALGVETFVIGFLVIERHETARPPLTTRRELAHGVRQDPAWFEWLFRWERMAQDPTFAARLLEARPEISRNTEIVMSHRAEAGRLRAVSCTISARAPFLFNLEGPPGLALLFERCDGSRTFAALREEMSELGVFPADMPVDEFVRLARVLVEGGVLEINDLRLPTAAGTVET